VGRQELDYGIYVVEQVKLCTLLNKGGQAGTRLWNVHNFTCSTTYIP
jgi:hypothetical protein